jgi:hypothetical protein
MDIETQRERRHSQEDAETNTQKNMEIKRDMQPRERQRPGKTETQNWGPRERERVRDRERDLRQDTSQRPRNEKVPREKKKTEIKR